MKISKYLLKPMKFLIILAMFVVLIYYRSVIFHSNVNKPVDVVMSYIEAVFDIKVPAHIVAMDDKDIQDVVQKEEQSIEVEVVEKNDELEGAEIVVDKEIKEVSSNDILKPESESLDSNLLVENKLNLIDELYETVNMINHKVDKLFESNDVISIVSGEVAEKEQPVAESQSVINESEESDISRQEVSSSTDIIESDTRKILFMARQSFWNGNTSLSEKFYIDLSQHEDTDPDIYGELGNVYYAQGKWKQAGEAYYEAAIRLLDLKQNGQVSYLLRVIQGLDASSADKLRQKISG